MAFTNSITYQTVMGDLRVVMGVFSNTGSETGGDVATGLSKVYYFGCTPTGSGVSADQCAVTETIPLDGGVVTIATTSAVDGMWIAYGK
jgi:hypothetical protein